MLSSYPVACPHANCDWSGSLVPSLLQGGADAEIASMHQAWFRCPRCQGDWEVRITNDRVTVLPAVERSSAFRDDVASKPARAIAFDVDAASLASLREVLPGWEIDTLNGAAPASLDPNWDPGAADLRIVSARGNATVALDLSGVLSFCTRYATEARDERGETLGPRDPLQRFLPDGPILILVPRVQESIAGAASEAEARGCLVLPLYVKDVASMLAHAWTANQPSRPMRNVDWAPSEDHRHDEGGPG